MFVPLDTRTVYTFLDSLVDLPTYISKAKELGYKHVGIMDSDTLYGAYSFIQQATLAGLKPILGLELSVIIAEQKIRLKLIAKNTVGYQSLLKISSQRMMGETDWTAFSELLKGIVVILPAEFVAVGDLLYCEYMIGVYPDSPQIAYEKPMIPLHTIRYFSNDDRETLQVLHAIRENVFLKDIEAPSANQFLYSPETMEQIFSERFPTAIDNLTTLVENISYEFDRNLKLPRFNRNREAVDELRERAEAGLVAKKKTESIYQERLNQELSVIHKMGFDDYFLIVWDLLRFGRSKGYYMGMGRGSAAGSLVSYALDITGIDPVKNNLLFERFLNEERYSMPDIDIDLPDIYRSEFLHYVRDRYGSQHSAQIVTFSTFGAKQAIRDVLKRFGVPEYELSNLTKKIGFRDTLTSVYEKNMAFRQLINSKAEYVKGFAIAKKIEGQPRQTSIHAAGIVMSDDDLTNHIPLKAGEDMMITQYDAPSVEANGLLKMDFLGLRNLTFVQKMQEKVLKDYGRDIDIKAIDLEDKETLQLFASGLTKGIFQFEQPGAISLLKRVKPEKFEEVVATTSLNRPGASDYIDNFIKRKFGREQVNLIDPIVAPILEPTYGIMLYQEQVMQIAKVYAGFTLGKADLLRRAMSKKDKKEMQLMEADFLAGARELGRPEQVARDLFERMAKFAGYGFNRSHAYAYSALAFQLAYFKVHYPEVFYDVMLNFSSSDYITDALQADFKLGKLTLNSVPYHDKIDDGKIVLGLKTVKGLPRDLALWIVENRPYQSIENFLEKLPSKYQKVEVLLPLVHIGLFDEFEPNRRKVEVNLEHLFTFVNELGSLFADSSYSWLTAEDYSVTEKYRMEQELLGVGISPHPLDALRRELQGNFTPIEQLIADSEGTVLAQIDTIRIIRTKTKGEQMAFLTVSDARHKLDVTLFPEVYGKWQSKLQEGAIYLFKGRLQLRDERIQMILQNLTAATVEKCWLQMANHDHDKIISEILSKYRGELPVVLHYVDSKKTLQSDVYYVQKSHKLIEELSPFVMKTIFR
ncbi:DNA polymerase III subunit alpha [Streptococcus sp. S784/96/1]|uniref:DNA polymerase III subunit alpha n=1 Tax=Streptococcus sp. S784/96/1 TaxID=2653499 RepID=UPI001386EDCA|nr:DNA polymerase III subunit alpha [Streptococcus sp. S784/96/1]